MAKNQDEFVVTGSGIKLAKDMVDQKSVAPQTDAQRHVRKWLGGVVGWLVYGGGSGANLCCFEFFCCCCCCCCCCSSWCCSSSFPGEKLRIMKENKQYIYVKTTMDRVDALSKQLTQVRIFFIVNQYCCSI